MEWGPWYLFGVIGRNTPDNTVEHKNCSRCGPKPIDEFYKGVSICIECWLFNDRNNPVRKKNIQRYRKKWADNNPEKIKACAQKRRAMKINATVDWCDDEKIHSIYKAAHELKDSNEEVYAVDHIVPLIGRRLKYDSYTFQVCGLHWEGNLRPLDKSNNSSKSNKLEPEEALHMCADGVPDRLRVYVGSRCGKKIKVATFRKGVLEMKHEELV